VKAKDIAFRKFGKEKSDMGTNLYEAASPVLLAASSYTTAITSLKSVLLTLGSAVGAVMLVYGGIKFAMAFRQMDQQGEHQAVYSVVAGGVLVGLSALVTALT
jgi:uncharacterized membrane protein YidH (DUF202 family)